MSKEEIQTQFKEVMGNYPTGVTIVTTLSKSGEPVGLTVNSFASVSLDPTLILWSIDHKVSSLKEFTEGEKFAVHVLAGDQQELCHIFASKKVDRFSSCVWSYSQNNLPIIEDVFGVFECKTYKTIEAGDHTILIGEVIHVQKNDKEPMMYHRRHVGPIPQNFYPVNK